MESLLILVLRNQAESRVLEWIVMHVAGAVIALGLYLGRGLRRANRLFERAGVTQELTLAKRYPDRPTWWIPESTQGLFAWLVIGALGAWPAYAAKALDRQSR